MAEGWIFHSGDFFVLVAESDQVAARAIAAKHFGREPDTTAQAMTQDLLDFFPLTRGQYATAVVFNSGTK